MSTEHLQQAAPSSCLTPLERAAGYAPWVIILCFFIFGAATIMTFPPVHYLGDELGMMRAGEHFVDDLLEGELPSHVTPRFFYTVLWGVGKAFGSGIVQYRAISLACSVLVLWLVFILGRELGGRTTGLVALLVVTGDYTFAWNSRLIRPEMMSTLFVLGAFTALVFASRRKDKAVLLVSGAALLVSLSINVHPNNLQYVVAMLFLFPVLFWQRLKSKETVAFAAGNALGFAFWMLWNYLPRLSVPAKSSVADVVARAPHIYSFPFLNENFFTLLWNSIAGMGRDYIAEYLKMACHEREASGAREPEVPELLGSRKAAPRYLCLRDHGGKGRLEWVQRA